MYEVIKRAKIVLYQLSIWGEQILLSVCSLQIKIMKEEWKDVVGFEGFYKVSNQGNIKSLPRQRRVGKLNCYISKERLLTPSKQVVVNYPRYRVNLWKNNVSKQVKVHRIVAQAFIPNPENKPMINHKDNNSLNNCVENLEWCTNLENIRYSAKQWRMNCGEKNGGSRFKEGDILKMRSLIKNTSKKDICKQFNVSISYLNEILRRNVWKHI